MPRPPPPRGRSRSASLPSRHEPRRAARPHRRRAARLRGVPQPQVPAQGPADHGGGASDHPRPAALNEFIARYPGAHAKRSKDYPQYLSRLCNATGDTDWKRFQATVPLFRTVRAALPPRLPASLGVGDITQAEPNVHGAIKYLRQLLDRHITGDGIDEQNRTLLALTLEAARRRLSARAPQEQLARRASRRPSSASRALGAP